MSSSIVITGGGGFVGRHLIAELTRAWPEHRIIVWDRAALTVPAGIESVVVDITIPASYEDSLRATQPAWIIHLAAVASAAGAARDPERAYAVNVTATGELLSRVAAVSQETRVVVVSTADIYGQGSAAPLPELDLAQAQPANPYAQSKWDMEKLIAENFLDRVIRVRPFPHIGPGQQLGYVTADFAAQIAAIEANQQPPVMKVGNLEAQRDFTDVRDVVRAYRLLMEHGQVGEVYHVASGVAVSIQSILDQLLMLTGRSIPVQQDPSRLRGVDTSVLVGDATKLSQATDWRPEIPLKQSLTDILTWWRERAAG